MNLTASFLLILALIQILFSFPCDEAYFKLHKTCTDCQQHCLSCKLPDHCEICENNFAQIGGRCYQACKYPYLTMMNENNQVYCQKVDTFSYSKVIKDIGDVKINNETRIFASSSDAMYGGLELSFWFKLQESYDLKVSEDFFLWTRSRDPLKESLNQPEIIRMALFDKNITVSFASSLFEFETEFEKWIFISACLEFPTAEYPYQKNSILITDPSREKNQNYIAYEIIPATLEGILHSVIYIGNLERNSILKFEMRNIRINALDYNRVHIGEVLMFSNDQGKFWDFSKKEVDQKIKSSDSDVLFLADEYTKAIDSEIFLDFMNEFDIYLITLEFLILDWRIPTELFTLKLDENIIYHADIIIHEQLIMVNESGTLFFPTTFPIPFRLTISVLENQLIFTSRHKNFRSDGGKLKLELNLNESLIKIGNLIISKSPSIFQNVIFIDPDLFQISGSGLYDGLNYTVRGITYNSIHPIWKYCNYGVYYFSEDECRINNFHSCQATIPDCMICEDRNICHHCGIMTVLDDHCVLNCPENYVSQRTHKIACVHIANISTFECLRAYDICHSSGTLNCRNKFLEGGCSLSNEHQKLCEENCFECKIINKSLACLKCEPGFALFEKKCLASCPNGFYEVNGFCKETLNSSNKMIKVKKKYLSCQPSKIGLEIFERCDLKISSEEFEYFEKNELLKPDISNCLLKRNRFCVLCEQSNSLHRGKCINKNLAENSIYMVRDEIFILQTNHKVKGICHSNCSTCSFNPQIKFLCEKPLIVSANSSTPKFEYVKEHTRYFCPDYLEGFHIIKIKDYCLKFQNTHYYILNFNPYVDSNPFTQEMLERPLFEDKILKCNESDPRSKIFFCVKNCSQGFYEFDGLCIPCLDYICDYQNASEIFFFAKNSFDLHLSKFIYTPSRLTMDRSGHINFITSKNYQKCPKSCKSCYYDDQDIYCQSCIDVAILNHRVWSNCQCPSNIGFFDHSTLSCKETCSPGMLENFDECVTDCLEPSAKASKFLGNFRYKDKCFIECPLGTYASLDYQTMENLECIGDGKIVNLIYDQKEIMDSKDYKKFQEYLESFYEIGIYKIQVIYSFPNFLINLKEVLINFEIKNSNQAENLVSIMLVLQHGNPYVGLEENVYFKGKNLVQKYGDSLNLHLKFIYFGVMVAFNGQANTGFCKYNCISQADIKNSSFALNLISKFSSAHLKFENISNGSCFVCNYYETEDRFIIGIRFSGEISNFNHKKFNFTMTYELDPHTNSYYANLTSKFLSNYFNNQSLELYYNCLYLFVFSKKSDGNTRLSIMIEHELFYPKRTKDNVAKEESDQEMKLDNQIKVVIVICCGILGVVFLVLVHKYLKKKTDERFNFKFVQMVEQVEDEDIDDELYENE